MGKGSSFLGSFFLFEDVFPESTQKNQGTIFFRYTVLSLGFILLRLPKVRSFHRLPKKDAEAITIDEIRRHLESKPVQQFFRQAWFCWSVESSEKKLEHLKSS
jgi:hypothetical protein